MELMRKEISSRLWYSSQFTFGACIPGDGPLLCKQWLWYYNELGYGVSLTKVWLVTQPFIDYLTLGILFRFPKLGFTYFKKAGRSLPREIVMIMPLMCLEGGVHSLRVAAEIIMPLRKKPYASAIGGLYPAPEMITWDPHMLSERMVEFYVLVEQLSTVSQTRVSKLSP